MSLEALKEAIALATGTAAYSGYADTGAQVPYSVVRPGTHTPDVAIAGNALEWDTSFLVYCCGASIEACYNLAKLVLSLQGTMVDGHALSCSLGYVGAQVESHYETAVTIQFNQGALS